MQHISDNTSLSKSNNQFWMGARILLLIAVAWVLSAPIPNGLHAQEKVVLTPEQWETGFHAFSQIMRKRGLEIYNDYEVWKDSPTSERILILMGDVSRDDQKYLNEFILEGGSALLATDAEFGPASVGGRRITISEGGRVGAVFSRDRYREIDGWPVIRNLERGEQLFEGVRQIVPNYPALLEIIPRTNTFNDNSGWQTIARYPSLQGFGRARPFVVRHTNINGGRLLVVPDHSVYVNGALGVNDNLRFMLNTVDWLREGNRKRCLFVLNRVNTAPLNVSNIDLYTAPPGAAETRRLLRDLWRNTTTRDKLELANEALEFAQEEELMEQIIDSVNLDEIISRNTLLKWALFTVAWMCSIAFVVVLVSNRKKPLEGNSVDGLKLSEKKEMVRREKVERARAAEALFVHFFNRAGMSVTRPEEVDPELLAFWGEDWELKRIKKDIYRIRNDLMRQPVDYWTDARVEDVGRHIAQWANLSETGVLRTESPAIQRGDEFSTS